MGDWSEEKGSEGGEERIGIVVKYANHGDVDEKRNRDFLL